MAFLRALTTKPAMLESGPDIENFYREHRMQHFADFARLKTVPDEKQDED